MGLDIESAFARIAVGGGSFHACTESQVVNAVREALHRGIGGRIITPNVDILRQARRDATVRAYLDDSDLVVADGMPLVWASRLAGNPLPERVCGSSLVWSLAVGLGRDGRSVYLLGGEPAASGGEPVAVGGGEPVAASGGEPVAVGGGEPVAVGDAERAAFAGYTAGRADVAAAFGQPALRQAEPAGRSRTSELVPGQPRSGGMVGGPGVTVGGSGGMVAGSGGAWRAAERLAAASPGLRIAGCHSPAYGFDRDPAAAERVCRAVVAAKPDLVYVGLGFPKQERLITRLRSELPFAWFLGCGAAVNFVAGDHKRAPGWMQRAGLEWVHRLAGEPRRLAGRYLRHDLPYALRLLAGACAARYRDTDRVSLPR